MQAIVTANERPGEGGGGQKLNYSPLFSLHHASLANEPSSTIENELGDVSSVCRKPLTHMRLLVRCSGHFECVRPTVLLATRDSNNGAVRAIDCKINVKKKQKKQQQQQQQQK